MIDNCHHPSALVYVLVLVREVDKPEKCIRWCRGCGAVHGWVPADRVVRVNGWMRPDGVQGDA